MLMMLALTRATLAALALVAIGWQFRLHIGSSYDPLNFFSYFTNLSNLGAAVTLLWSAFAPRRHGTSLDIARFVSAVNMTVVGVVFSALLRNVDLGDLLPWINLVLHYVMPVAVVADWLIQPPASHLGRKVSIGALAFPFAYLLYTLVRGAGTGWYPYPFLNPANVGGYGGVTVYAIGITVTFAVVAWIVRATGNRRGATGRR